jgi:hypothetical protein
MPVKIIGITSPHVTSHQEFKVLGEWYGTQLAIVA